MGSVVTFGARLRLAVVLFAVLPFAACGDPGAPAFDDAVTDPMAASFVTSDIPRFWQAWDAFQAGGGSAVFDQFYLQGGSPGLLDYARTRGLTAAQLTQMVQAYPQYFADIRPNTLALDTAVLARIRLNYAAMKARYPNAVFPPATFLIGRFTTGGTVRPSGILVGLEFFAGDATTPLGELGQFQRANARTLDALPVIVAHEHVHVLQLHAGGLLAAGPHTLLEKALLEGSADFLGELVSGGHINGAAHAYGLAHEAQLWAEFSAAMDGTNVSAWLYNQGSAGATRPGDLGYFVGYRIAQAYYDAAADQAAAVREILGLGDAQAFLAASGYAPALR